MIAVITVLRFRIFAMIIIPPLTSFPIPFLFGRALTLSMRLLHYMFVVVFNICLLFFQKCGIVINWKRVQGADGKLQGGAWWIT